MSQAIEQHLPSTAMHGDVVWSVSAPTCVGDGLHQSGVTVKVRKTLAQIDGPFFCGQCRHDGKDGGADLGQFGLQRRGAWGRGVHGGRFQSS